MLPCHQCGASADDTDRFCSACGANLERDDPSNPGDPLLGRTIGGAYLLQELIGVGGMGRVYRGVQNMLGRTVALKVIHPHLLGDEQTVARFYNEARAASRLNHPDSVGIIDFGRTEDGILYLVMEHLAGKDLATVLAEEGPLPFKRIVHIIKHVVSALGEAHALGVIHRDLKPENIIVSRSRKGEESVKVVDFGLATITGAQSTSITTPGLVCGTPDYMSPEQGKGEELDGRADLYSVGVMLFEALTDRLPYVDDTPTKVVLRHIHDPVPDPRKIAPQRGIPNSLAEIAIRALSKRPADRFQSADEMFEALRRAEDTLGARAGEHLCPTCGAINPPTVRFCGECGTRLTGVFTLPPARTQAPPAARSQVGGARAKQQPLIGRHAELDQLMGLRGSARERPVWMRIVGEPGVGKTRLMREMAQQCEAASDFVVVAGPHPSGAPVPYWTVRELIVGLLDIDQARLDELAKSSMVAEPLARAGIAEIVEPRGLLGVPRASRAGAVAAALAASVRVASERSASGLVVLMVDDLMRCDGLSRDALTRMFDLESLPHVLLVTTSGPTRDAPHASSMQLALRGLEAEEANHFLSGTVPSEPRRVSREAPTSPGARLLLPLYLEQVRALGAAGWGDETLPPRLADAVMARVARLDLPPRRLLQAIAVSGDRVDIDALREIAPGADLSGLDALVRTGFVSTTEREVEIAHPFVRELVEASIPAEARKELHARALAHAAGQGAALEVRADHAFKSGEPMSALLLLERMGDAGLARGDASASVLAFRRGLDLARRELLLSGESSLDRAMLTFSRKLGDALSALGDHAGADGVLREALEIAGPRGKDRPRMLLDLGRIALERDRRRDAVRLLGQAIEAAESNGDRRTEAEAQIALAKARRGEGDAIAAANALRRACDLYRREGGAETSLALAELEHVDLLVELSDYDLAEEELRDAHALAAAAGAGALVARSLGLRALVTELRGESSSAAVLYREAAQAAADAGDAVGADRWRTAAGALGRVSAA